MKTALLLSSGLDESLRELLHEACRTGDFRLTSPDECHEPFDVIVAQLETGQRSIPSEVRRLAEASGRPSLLLCREPLVDGARTLSTGALTLLGAPHSARRIAARLRAIVPSDPPATQGWHAQEWRSSLAWSAALARAEADSLVEQEASAGEIRWTLSTRGERRSLLEVDLAARRARFFLPGSMRAWLLSPRRLPPIWEFTQGERLERFTAGGDVLLLAHWSGVDGGASFTLGSALPADGPALFDSLRESAGHRSPDAALIVEFFE